MAGRYEIVNCPFCQRGQISCLYFPSATTVKVRHTATFGRSIKRSKNPEVWVIKSGCNVCRRTAEEVERKLREQDMI